MIDNFALGLTHGLLLYAAWKLFHRPDLDTDTIVSDTPNIAPKRGWGRR